MPAKPNRSRLTQLGIERLNKPGTYWDTHLPAFGLRVTPNRKSWIVFYRVKGKAIFETLGTTWLIPKIDTARDMAREKMLKARSGVNPVEQKRAAKQQEASKESTQFKAVIERYFTARAVAQKAGTAKEARRLIEKDVLHHWAKKDISTISSAEVRRLLDKIQDRGGTLIVANSILLQLRSFFRWAARAEFIGKDPTASIDKLVKTVERDRVLSDEEIVKFWSACDVIGWPYGGLFKLLLLTGQRRDEVGQMEWSELDIGNQLWTLPGNRSKNGRLHEIHLSDTAIEILQGLPVISNSKYVFSTNRIAPVSGWSAAKRSIDQVIGDIPNWRLHDLRRTCASGMARLNIAPHVVDKILNHSSGAIRGVAAVYNRYQYADERVQALDAWSRYIADLLNPAPSNVTQMRSAKRVRILD